MIRADRIPLRGKIRGELIHLLPRETVDNARLVFIAFEHLDGLRNRILFTEDFEVEILPVETGNEFVRGCKLERGANILADSGGGGGGERKADRLRESLSHFDQLAIFRSEVMAPL